MQLKEHDQLESACSSSLKRSAACLQNMFTATSGWSNCVFVGSCECVKYVSACLSRHLSLSQNTSAATMTHTCEAVTEVIFLLSLKRDITTPDLLQPTCFWVYPEMFSVTQALFFRALSDLLCYTCALICVSLGESEACLVTMWWSRMFCHEICLSLGQQLYCAIVVITTCTQKVCMYYICNYQE